MSHMNVEIMDTIKTRRFSAVLPPKEGGGGGGVIDLVTASMKRDATIFTAGAVVGDTIGELA